MKDIYFIKGAQLRFMFTFQEITLQNIETLNKNIIYWIYQFQKGPTASVPAWFNPIITKPA